MKSEPTSHHKRPCLWTHSILSIICLSGCLSTQGSQNNCSLKFVFLFNFYSFTFFNHSFFSFNFVHSGNFLSIYVTHCHLAKSQVAILIVDMPRVWFMCSRAKLLNQAASLRPSQPPHQTLCGLAQNAGLVGNYSANLWFVCVYPCLFLVLWFYFVSFHLIIRKKPMDDQTIN